MFRIVLSSDILHTHAKANKALNIKPHPYCGSPEGALLQFFNLRDITLCRIVLKVQDDLKWTIFLSLVLSTFAKCVSKIIPPLQLLSFAFLSEYSLSESLFPSYACLCHLEVTLRDC